MVRVLIHAFSIELKSKEFLRNVAVKGDVGEKVLVEGYLGELKEALLQENSMFEARGSNGVIKIDLTGKDFGGLLSKTPHMKTQYE